MSKHQIRSHNVREDAPRVHLRQRGSRETPPSSLEQKLQADVAAWLRGRRNLRPAS